MIIFYFICNSVQQPVLSENGSASQSLSDVECLDIDDFELSTSRPLRKQVPYSLDTFFKSKEKVKNR